MKIGEFAHKYHLTIYTVRYYMEIGLLIPTRKDKQYDFDNQCCKEIELISKLKSYYFSIQDIHKVLSIYRLSHLTDEQDIDLYIKSLQNQQQDLWVKENSLADASSRLTEEIEQCKLINKPVVPKTGVPLTCLAYLYCPHCNIPLQADNVHIENQQITDGTLFCSCGYHAKIQDGIVITPGNFISKYDSPYLERTTYYAMSTGLVNLLQQSFQWITKELAGLLLQGGLIVEDHLNCNCFLQTHLDKMPKDAVFVLIDKFPEIVKMYKQAIEKEYPDRKIIYIADSSFNYPLQKESIDLYIDFTSSNEYRIFRPEHLLNRLKDYFHPATAIVGTYLYFGENTKSLQLLQQQYPENHSDNYRLEPFRQHLDEQFSVVTADTIGFVIDSGQREAFTFHNPGDKFYAYSYLCKNDKGQK